jgi:phage tail sheath gpL-like
MADVPVAVSPTVRTPGTALLVNLLAGASSPGSSVARALVIAPKSSSGSQTADTVKTGVGGEAQMATLLGAGTPGHLAAKNLFGEYGLAQVDLACCAEPTGVAATQTVTFAGGPPAATRTVNAKIMGRPVSSEWIAGQSNTLGAQAFRDAVNLKTREHSVTATENGAGVVTLTFKHKGTMGNDCQVYVTVTGGSGGTVTAGGAFLTGGTGEIDVVTVLGLVSTSEYRYIVIVTSNTDIIAASATGAFGRVKTHIETYKSGFGARLQNLIAGCTSTTSAGPKAATAYHNYERAQLVFSQNGQSLPCEWAGAEAGARMREEALQPNVNRCRVAYRVALYVAYDEIADKLTDAEVEDLLQYGVTPADFEGSTVYPVRPITTHYKDTDGNPDNRVLDVGRVIGTDVMARDVQTGIAQEFQGGLLVDNIPPGQDIPEGVIEIREIKTFARGRVLFWCTRGVVQQPAFLAAVEDGSFIVRINPSDPTQVDIVIPSKIVAIHAKTSVVVNNNGT